jgi:alpha-glucosidase
MGGPAAFYGNGHDELHLVFNFHLLKSVWRADDVRRIVRTWDESIPEGAWPTQVLSNHDQPRHFNRYGRGVGEEVAARRGRAAALLLLTLRGTPFLYYGEEIGMRDTPLAYRDLKDPYTRRYWPFMKGRDPARTPMRWDPSTHAGFTTGRPWLPIGADTDRVNVACEAADPTSMFSLYRRIIRIRKSSPALQLGAYHEVPCAHQDWFVYMRSTGMGGHGTERMLVAMNFGDQSGTFAVQSVSSSGRIVLSTDPASHETAFNAACVRLGPDEGILVRLE